MTSRPAAAQRLRDLARLRRVRRPDRPGVRAAAGRGGARPRREHVGRAPQPRVPACLRRVAVRLSDDAAHRARDGAAASSRSQRHRGLFRGRVGPADQPGTSIVLDPPAANPGITDDERRTIAEMMAKGTYAMLLLATKDLDGTFERLQASDADVVPESTEQPYGVRDCPSAILPAT